MRIGRTLGGRYRLDAQIASGGMGSVWRGTDTRLGRTVAVKVLHSALSNDDVFQSRFRVEARAVAALKSPGVIRLYDSGEDHGPDGPASYLVMEYVSGRSLQDLLSDRQTLDEKTTMRVVSEAADALHSAHEAGIIHRDIKPANLLVDDDDRTKIIDFGIALAGGSVGLTSTGMVMGTAAYVSPEQLRGADPSGSSDVYALGVVAYECLSGRYPYPTSDTTTIASLDPDDGPHPLPEWVDPQVADVVMRALAKDPARRWPDAAAFARAAREAVGLTPVVGDPLLTPPPEPPSATRSGRWIALAVGIAVILAMLALALLPGWNETAHPPQRIDDDTPARPALGITTARPPSSVIPDVVLLSRDEALKSPTTHRFTDPSIIG